MTVVPQHRAAAGAVDDDVIGAAGQAAEVFPGQMSGGVAVAGVLMRGTAAGLVLHLYHPVPVGLERPPSRLVHFEVLARPSLP